MGSSSAMFGSVFAVSANLVSILPGGFVAAPCDAWGDASFFSSRIRSNILHGLPYAFFPDLPALW